MIENELKTDNTIFSKLEELKVEDTPKKNKNSLKKTEYKEKECRVIRHNRKNCTLDIMFDNYGIRLKNVENIAGDIITIKYKSEIGKPGFRIELQVVLCVKTLMNEHLNTQKKL